MRAKKTVYGSMKRGGKIYANGGVNGDDKRKSLQSQLMIARDPKTSYASEEQRQKDIASIQAKIKALGK